MSDQESLVLSGCRSYRQKQWAKQIDHLQWLIKLIQVPESLYSMEELELNIEDKAELVRRLTNGSPKEKYKTLAVLGRIWGIPYHTLHRALEISVSSISIDWKRFKESGANRLFRKPRPGPKKADNEPLKNAIFALLHSPPAHHGINRTSWRLADIRQCLLREGVRISNDRISEIIRAAGYKYRKAKTVLTSHDPEYREKLERIKSILSELGANDRFCSIDEFGPFAIKMKGGKRLVGPDDYPHVPQFQKSKGWLIVTAALELSQNQVTHFYSKAGLTTGS